MSHGAAEPLMTWVDGELQSSVSILDRGLQYGDGVFETIACRRGCLRFVAQHVARLQQGCERLQIAFDAHRKLTAELERASRLAPPVAIIKVIVTRGDALPRGYGSVGRESPRRIVTMWPDAPLPESLRAQGAAVRFGQLRLARNPRLAGIKHLNRLEQVLARAEWHDAGTFESLLTDSEGHLVSGTMSNVFALKGQTLVTPPVDQCGVAGVLRAVVLREAAHFRLEPSIAPVSVQRLLNADAVFLTNARIGVLPVSRLGGRTIPIDARTRALAAHVEQLDA